jgi:hypothetical protein
MQSSLFLLVIFFTVGITAQAQICEPNANQAAFYVDTDYRGACVVRGEGSYATLDRLGLPNDTVSSIKLGANVSVRVCEHIQFGGRCHMLTGSVLWMANTSIGDNSLSSYQVIVSVRPVATPSPRPVQTPTGGNPISPEQACINAVQGRVAWDTAGNRTWGENNLRALCRGTINPSATISCFQTRMPQVGWQQAIQDCSRNPNITNSGGPQNADPVRPVGPNPGGPNPTGPALSASDMNQVMKWIAVRTSALRLPFCWRDSYTRPGRAATCPEGYTNVGVTCLREASTYSAPSRLADCPRGYTNMGLDCQKGANIFDRTSKMTCPSGYFMGAAKRCYQNCRPGYTNNGEFCGVGASTLGMDSMKCRPGESREGAFCYPTCKAGYSGSLNFCSQKCPTQQSTDCGLGCATSSGECRSAIFDMASAPIIAAVNIATLGRAAPAIKAAKVAASVSKMQKAVDLVKKTMKAAGTVSDAYTVASSVKDQVDLFATEFSDNFEVMTSPEIAAEIDRNFSARAANQIKRQWGMRHLTLMLEADGFATAKNIMSVVGVFDPTGVVDVVNAFAHPICKPDTPFPRVTPLY